MIGRPAPNLDRPGDVLELLVAAVCERRVDQAAEAFIGDAGERQAARRARLLQARRHVDTVTQDVLAVDDDITEVDAETEYYAPVVVDTSVALSHALLDSDGALSGVDHGGEFEQQSVAHGLDDAAAMFGDLGIDHFVAMGA